MLKIEMYKKVVVLILISVFYNKIQVCAQDTKRSAKKDSVHINYVVNVIPDKYDTFLWGFVNIGKGSHKKVHIASIFNWTRKNFRGFQFATANFTKGNLSGFQFGVFNNCYDTLKGLQIGVFNVAKINHGTQIGFVNYSDTVLNGRCIGVASFIRKATFHTIEFGVNEMLPFNLSYKLGLPDRYASFNFSNNVNFSSLFLGFGTGFNIPVRKRFLFNPDYILQYSLNSSQKMVSVTAKLSYQLFEKIFLSAGPSFVWNFSSIKNDLQTPFYYLYNNIATNERHQMVLGMRLSLRYRIK